MTVNTYANATRVLVFFGKFPCKFSAFSSSAAACFFCFLFRSCCSFRCETTIQTRNFECVYRVCTWRSNMRAPHTHTHTQCNILPYPLTKDSVPCSNDYIVTTLRKQQSTQSKFKPINYTSLVLATLICMHALLIKYIAPSNKMEYCAFCWLRLGI